VRTRDREDRVDHGQLFSSPLDDPVAMLRDQGSLRASAPAMKPDLND
jgi:hypothetical protein